MKRISLGIFIVFTVFLLAACGKKVTTEDLKANDWIAESSNDEDPNMIISFSDHVMSVSVDTDSMQSTAENEWEKLGEELAKQLVDQMNYKLEYILEKDSIKIQDTEDKDAFVYYTVSKEDETIIFTPDKKKNEKDSDAQELVLKPYKKKEKESTSSTSTEEVASSQKAAAAEKLDVILDNFKIQPLVVYNPRDMTREDFGMAPMSAIGAKIFSLVETDNEDEQRNARILMFDNLDDLRATKKYYDDLGKDSAMLFSYTAVNEDALLLMQFNGQLPQELVEKYTEAASLELTNSPFNSDSNTRVSTETSVASSVQEEPVYSEQSSPAVETPTSTEQQQTYESAVKAPPAEEYTTVQSGEGLPQVAARVGISVEKLCELNGIDPNNYMLYPGDTLRVK